MKKEIDIEEVREFIEQCGPDTKIYIGADSERYKIGKEWFADYILAVVVHINGNNGCKIFGAVTKERDFDAKFNRPRLRLMNEVYKVAELYVQLAAVIPNDIEVHLDINSEKNCGSNFMYAAGIGLLQSAGYVAKGKPFAKMASNCAYHFCR